MGTLVNPSPFFLGPFSGVFMAPPGEGGVRSEGERAGIIRYQPERKKEKAKMEKSGRLMRN
jgi:hypothetical protein